MIVDEQGEVNRIKVELDRNALDILLQVKGKIKSDKAKKNIAGIVTYSDAIRWMSERLKSFGEVLGRDG